MKMRKIFNGETGNATQGNYNVTSRPSIMFDREWANITENQPLIPRHAESHAEYGNWKSQVQRTRQMICNKKWHTDN